MLRNPIPDGLIEFVSCNCKKTKCKNKQCICVAHGLNCTDMCSCDDCDNRNMDVNDNFEDSDVESEDSDSCDEFDEDDDRSDVESEVENDTED